MNNFLSKNKVVIILIIIFLFAFKNDIKESFNNLGVTNPKYKLSNPTKCFSCEDQMSENYKWMGQPSKCFDCEKQLVANYGPKYGKLGNPSKCLSCPQYLN